MRSQRVPPWRRRAPVSGRQSMTDEQIERARMRAVAAGRPYPNLVDNLAVLREDRSPPPRKKK